MDTSLFMVEAEFEFTSPMYRDFDVEEFSDKTSGEVRFAIPKVYFSDSFPFPAQDQVVVWNQAQVTSVHGLAGSYDPTSLLFRIPAGDQQSELVQLVLKEAFRTSDPTALTVVTQKTPAGAVPLVLPADVDYSYDQVEYANPVLSEHVKQAYTAFTDPLSDLARCLGIRGIHIHSAHPGIVVPFGDDERVVHIVMRATPPGDYYTANRTHIQGHALHPRLEAVTCVGPTKGRGLQISDSADVVMATVIGNTWYIHCPLDIWFNGDSTLKILNEILVAIWACLWIDTAEIAALNETTLSAQLAEWQDRVVKTFLDRQTALQAQVVRLQRELADTLGQLRALNASLSGLQADPLRHSDERLRGTAETILAEELVDSVTYVQDGLHVHLKPLIVEHEGARYALGTLTVRLNLSSQVYVWSDKPTHPRGIAHPHVDAAGNPCLGNATQAVIQALTQDRLADAVRYVLNWLQYGYTPELAAHHKLTEWPLAT